MSEFRAMVWQWALVDEERHTGTLHSVHELEADDVAAAATQLLRQLSEQEEGQGPPGAQSFVLDAMPVHLGERLLIDVQDKAMPVEHKLAEDFAGGARGEWFLVCGALPDLNAVQIERAEALMSDRFPQVRFSSEHGAVAYAVATIAVLADEAHQDVEDALTAVGDALGLEDLTSGSSSCGRVGDERPAEYELLAGLREAHEDHRATERWRTQHRRSSDVTNFVLCERPFDDAPLVEGRAQLVDALGGHSGGRALEMYDEVDKLLSRLDLRDATPGSFLPLNVSDEDLVVLRANWEALQDGGLRLIGRAFMVNADDVRATFERENLEGVEERLAELRDQGRLIEGDEDR